MTLLDRIARWLWIRRLPVHEEITARYKALRGKSTEEYEVAILEKLFEESEK